MDALLGICVKQFRLVSYWSERAQRLLHLGRTERRLDGVQRRSQIAVQLIGRTRPTKPRQVNDDVAFDCEQPSPHRAQAGVETLAAPPSARERLLDRVLGQFRIAQGSPREAQELG